MSTNIEDILNPAPPVPPPQMSPELIRQQTREQRLARYQNLITNFTFSLGEGLKASAEAHGGARNRTMAGVGAALIAPEYLRQAQQKIANEQALMKQREAQTAGITERTQRDAQMNELVPLINPETQQPFMDANGQPIQVPRGRYGFEYAKMVQAQQAAKNAKAIADQREAGLNTRATNAIQAQADRQNVELNSRATEGLLNRMAQQTRQDLSQKFQSGENQLNREAAQKRTETTAAGAMERAKLTGAPKGYVELQGRTKDMVDQVADKVASGEYTIQQGISALGGVRGGLGTALTEALSTKRVLPPKVRDENTSIERARNILVPVHELVDKINAATTTEDKVRLSAQLEGYVSSIGTQFARARGERGVVTDQDVKRVSQLLPGWKSANFAPKFAADNLKLIEDAFDRDQQALLGKYFTKVNSGGGTASEEPDFIAGPQGFPIPNPRKRK